MTNVAYLCLVSITYLHVWGVGECLVKMCWRNFANCVVVIKNRNLGVLVTRLAVGMQINELLGSLWIKLPIEHSTTCDSRTNLNYKSVLLYCCPNCPNLLRQCCSNRLGSFGNLCNNKETQPCKIICVIYHFDIRTIMYSSIDLRSALRGYRNQQCSIFPWSCWSWLMLPDHDSDSDSSWNDLWKEGHLKMRLQSVSVCGFLQFNIWYLHINSYSASHNNWCTATLWNRIITAQCEVMGEVGSARYEPALLPPCPSIRALCYRNCQRSTQSHQQSKG